MACTSMWKFWEALGAERSEVETEYVRWMMTTSGGWRSNSGLVAKLAIVLLSTLNASWVSQRRLESSSEKQSWKVWPGTSLVFCRYQRVPDRASRVGPDYPGLQSERQAPRSRPLRGVLHILISSDQQWLETVPASSNSDRVRGVWISDWKKADLLTAPPYAARETLPS